MCECTNPTLTDVSPSSGPSGSGTTSVTASIANGSATVMYTLVLTPISGGNDQTHAQINNRVATVTGLPMGACSAFIRVMGGTVASTVGASYDTGLLASAFTAN